MKARDNIVVIEIKADKDDSEENKAKHRWAKKYFQDLNEELKKKHTNQKYFFHFISPESYPEFEKYFIDGKLFKGKFRSTLEDLLELSG